VIRRDPDPFVHNQLRRRYDSGRPRMIGLRSRTSPASMRAPTERRAPATLRRVELQLSHLCAMHDRHFGVGGFCVRNAT
jgi:hypothetical protein